MAVVNSVSGNYNSTIDSGLEITSLPGLGNAHFLSWEFLEMSMNLILTSRFETSMTR